MNPKRQPIYLFADSQLLFWDKDSEWSLGSVIKGIQTISPSAAYIGASNGDAPEFYEIFCAAMEKIGIRNCRNITSSFPNAGRAFLESADIILLAGGDAEKGWQIIQRTGMAELLVQRYHNGAVLMGISAGALQLGLSGLKENGSTLEDLFGTLKLIPFIIHSHDEKADWRMLKRTVLIQGRGVRGIGIPTGGGMIYHPDHSIEPIRHPLCEFSEAGGQLTQSIIFPGQKLL